MSGRGREFVCPIQHGREYGWMSGVSGVEVYIYIYMNESMNYQTLLSVLLQKCSIPIYDRAVNNNNVLILK